MAYTTRITFQGAMLDFLQAESERFGQPIGDIVRNCVRDAMAQTEQSQPRTPRSKSTKPAVAPTTVVGHAAGQAALDNSLSVDDVDVAFCEHGHKLTYDPENSCPQCIEEFLRS